VFKETDVDFIPKEMRTKEDWSEIIPEGTKSKVNFTVSIQSDINDKFNEIMIYYQTQHKYGKVYKHLVLQLIIDEVHTRMKSKRYI
jgi:hypothetical protein